MGKSFYDSVSVLKNVGDKRLKALNDLGIHTIADLLHHFPFRYEDIQVKSLFELEDQEKTSLKGEVIADPVISHFGYKKNRLSFKMKIEHAVITVTFFNQSYLAKQIIAGNEMTVYGKWDDKRKSLTGIKIVGQKSSQPETDFESVYHTNKHIRQKTLLTLIQQAFKEYQDVIPENVPDELREKFRLISHKEAIYAMHFPASPEQTKQARREVVFEEFLVYQTKIQLLRKKQKKTGNGLEIDYDNARLKAFINKLPFELTNAQKRVVNEICKDMKRPLHMHRLLQGDVGSGKTLVAITAIYAAFTAGFQSALMVPTTILAEQHMNSLNNIFDPLEVKTALLTGSTTAKEKRLIEAQLRNGEIDVVVGTHALIQDTVEFAHLGLVITDEQHRFGVNQRKQLLDKGQEPDVLFMTATPIPRTLAITAFGEMDISIIDEMPAGRKPIQTTWVKPNQFEHTLEFIERELRRGSQAYVICPLIDESESLDVKNATEVYLKLSQFYQGKFTVGLLHGQMKPQEKEDVMEEFKRDNVQVLVSTTVIEVGVDVPNATTMVIYDADRFGLAQLHQLRGRVGRGDKESFCILVADPKGDTGKERMRVMTETNDGFLLSEKDLELRGPGDVFGNKQSGIPDFKVGDIVSDFAALETARYEAAELVLRQDFYTNTAFADLRAAVDAENKKAEIFH